MTVIAVAGTTAEFIKLAPVLAHLDRDGIRHELWTTCQHVEGVPETLAALGCRGPDRQLVGAGHRIDITRTTQVPLWAARVFVAGLRALATTRRRRRLAGGDADLDLVLVHGDTMSTVLGALAARLSGLPVAHLEAGLSSTSLRDPFPEELNRRIVRRLSRVHFAPTAHEVANLERAGARGTIVHTHGNTVVDALVLADPEDAQPPGGQADGSASTPELPAGPFGLVTLHRHELLRDGAEFARTVRLLAGVDPAWQRRPDTLPLVFVAGGPERRTIAETGLTSLVEERFVLVPKRPYAAFLPVLRRAAFVVTDSGGLQEECAALGIPCAVHRRVTERRQGLGDNVVLTRMEPAVLVGFLSRWRDFARPRAASRCSPSAIVAEHLAALTRATPEAVR